MIISEWLLMMKLILIVTAVLTMAIFNEGIIDFSKAGVKDLHIFHFSISSCDKL